MQNVQDKFIPLRQAAQMIGCPLAHLYNLHYWAKKKGTQENYFKKENKKLLISLNWVKQKSLEWIEESQLDDNWILATELYKKFGYKKNSIYAQVNYDKKTGVTSRFKSVNGRLYVNTEYFPINNITNQLNAFIWDIQDISYTKFVKFASNTLNKPKSTIYNYLISIRSNRKKYPKVGAKFLACIKEFISQSKDSKNASTRTNT